MTSIRLLACVWLFAASVLAQTQGKSLPAFASSPATAVPSMISETWRIPEQLPEAIATDAVVFPLAANLDKGIAISPSGDGSNDGFCFKIRSYVVARDSKDSEATHFVRSSTCQPANRYGLKSTFMKPSPSAQ
jgi:hypothetical protein